MIHLELDVRGLYLQQQPSYRWWFVASVCWLQTCCIRPVDGLVDVDWRCPILRLCLWLSALLRLTVSDRDIDIAHFFRHTFCFLPFDDQCIQCNQPLPLDV